MLVQRSMDAQLRAVRLILAQPSFSRGALYSPLVKLFVMNDYNCTRGTFRLSLPLIGLHGLEILARPGPASLTGGRRRSSPGEHVLDSKLGFLSVWRREQGMERGPGAS